ncbi:MAG: hypothetical protein V4444_11020 [Pseudomonadota bacterium]
MRKAISYTLAFVLYAIIFLACSAIARIVLLFINDARAVPDTPWDYIVGALASALAGAAGVTLAFAALEKWFTAVHSRKVAWAWMLGRELINGIPKVG